uniref:Activated leukocyte cell adhesion molecule b n=1 Tax=Oreochromis niloticus TaxID=8128 RepID=I3JYV3_ORENI
MCLWCFSFAVTSLELITGQYGEMLKIPCNSGAIKAEDIAITKWKYDKGDGVPGYLLVKQKNQNVSISATDEYKVRVSMDENSSLLISAAKLSDQRTFTCMVVTGGDVFEYPVNVLIHKLPAKLEISEKAEELEIGRLTKLGKCVAKDANPPANITWFKNNKPLEADGKGISIKASVAIESGTGLSTTTSILEYSATKEDTGAKFECRADSLPLESSSMNFTITYSTENIMLEVSPQKELKEGDNLTLKCVADGNPAPTSFNFHLKGELVTVENTDTYTIANVSRNATGEYKCSLIDDTSMEATRNITVTYLDINLSPSGNIVKLAGDALNLSLQIDSSGKAEVSWTKNNTKLDKQPDFTKLGYSDSGRYEWTVTVGHITRTASFDLTVEGKGPAVIKSLFKNRSNDGQHKVLTCEAEGSPKPAVSWSINGTLLSESPFINGKITHKIKVVPSANLTVHCTVTNRLGKHDTHASDISVLSFFTDQSEDSDQTRLVVGVIVGLLIATLVIGLAYWVYSKKSNCCQGAPRKISPTSLTLHQQPEPLIQGRMNPCSGVIYAKFTP